MDMDMARDARLPHNPQSPTVLGAVAAHSLDGSGHCDSAALRSSHVFSRSPSWDRAAA